jgi:hypothetical protein
MSDARGTKPEAAPVDESEKTLSLMGGIVRPEGLPEADMGISDGPKGKLLGQGTLLLLIVFVVGAGTLYAMRLSKVELHSSKSIKEVEARIEQALAKLDKVESMRKDDPLAAQNLNALFQDTGSIVAMFSTDMTQRQVPIEYIKKDPFVSMLPAATKADGKPDPDNKSARERKHRIEMEFADLKLQTVMQGRVPVAVISGQFVRTGQTLGSFVVKAIDGMSVTLEADGQPYTLQIQTDDVKTSKQSLFRR